MDRGWTARTAGIAGLLLALATGAVRAQPAPGLTDEQLLAGADDRIREYRMSDAILELRDPQGHPLPAGVEVRIEQTKHAFLFGCGLFKRFDDNAPPMDTEHERYFADLFNYTTIGFFWWWYEKTPGTYRDGRTEHFINWCKKHDIVVQGSPLAWNFYDPAWLSDDLDKAMNSQIRQVERTVQRFAGDVRYWVTVNEPTPFDTPAPRAGAPKLTAAIEKIGLKAYMHRAFKAARRADPDAKLIINDWRLDEAFATRALRQLVDEQGEPMYDVIGLQAHQHRGPMPLTEAWAVCERFARFGKPLQWSEITFLSGQEGWLLADTRPEGWVWASTPEGEERQATQAVRFYKLIFSHPAVEGATWWQLSDRWAWQKAPAGLLRRDFTPKPAYHALRKLIKETWWTKGQYTTDPTGTCRFRGFLGDYRVTVQRGEQTFEARCTLGERPTQTLCLSLAVHN